MSMPQQTIEKAVSYKGNGLHSGVPVTMTFKPAPVDTGIVFVRTDIEGHPSVLAHIDNVTNTMRATTLENGQAKVFTIEHVMAAFHAMGIDNCYVELDSPEPPVGDGSSAVFIQMIEDAHIVAQDKARKVHKIRRSHSAYDGDKFIVAIPYDGLRMTFTSINDHPMLQTQQFDITITPDTFKENIGSARTVGFMKELEALRAMGLAKGGTLENAVVYDDTTCLSELRYEDELVRHKILDVMGDLYLLGPIEGHIIAVKSSHALNARLAQSIVDEIREAQS